MRHITPFVSTSESSATFLQHTQKMRGNGKKQFVLNVLER